MSRLSFFCRESKPALPHAVARAFIARKDFDEKDKSP
jgi:hypothetical protein